MGVFTNAFGIGVGQGALLNLLPFKDDLSFHTIGRTGLSMVDEVGGNNAKILLPSVMTAANGGGNVVMDRINTGIIPSANTIFIIRGRNVDIVSNIVREQGNSQMNIGRAYPWLAPTYSTRNTLSFKWGNSAFTGTETTQLAINDTVTYTWVIYDKRLWQLASDISLTDESIINVINTIAPVYNMPSATWVESSEQLYLGKSKDSGQCMPFEWNISFIGTINTGAITWQRKYIFNNADFAIDILNGTHASWNNLNVVRYKIYSDRGDISALTSGFEKFNQDYKQRIDLAKNNGASVGDNNNLLPYYMLLSVNDGFANKHNMCDSLIEFTGVNFDRSNVVIYNDVARLGYYDSANPKRWHIDELDRVVLNSFLKDDYKGTIFVKKSKDGLYLDEIYSFNTNKIGNDYIQNLRYCGDLQSENYVYLSKPYVDALRITAISDAKFRLNFNNCIVYTDSDLADIIKNQNPIHEGETLFSKICRYYYANYRDDLPISDDSNYIFYDPLLWHNSTSMAQCGGGAISVMSLINMFPELEGFDIYGSGIQGHLWINSPGTGYFDLLAQKHFNKTKNTFYDTDELKNQHLFFTEPIFRYKDWIPMFETYFPYSGTIHNEYSRARVAIDLYMQIPKDAYVEMPVKSNNVITSQSGAAITRMANAIVTIPTGVTGIVDMPFILAYVGGNGVINIKGVEYNLPTDKDVVNAMLHQYANFYHNVNILANTGGIELEYMGNQRTMILMQKNEIKKTIISGDIRINSIHATLPVPTSNVVFGNKDNNIIPVYNLNSYNGVNSIYVPAVTGADTHSFSIVTYKNKIGGKVLDHTTISAGGSGVKTLVPLTNMVYGRCFSAKLNPLISSFTTSVELSFDNSVDPISNVFYTIDGTTPDATKTLYVAPFTISVTTTVKWINIKADYANSHVNSRVITKTA